MAKLKADREALLRAVAEVPDETPRLGSHCLEAWVADPNDDTLALAIETLQKTGPLVLRNGEPDPETGQPAAQLYSVKGSRIVVTEPRPDFTKTDDDDTRSLQRQLEQLQRRLAARV